MRFTTHSFREGDVISQQPDFRAIYNEIVEAISSITDDDLRSAHVAHPKAMSLSYAINDLLKERLVERGWNSESPIFQITEYQEKHWRLDFAKVPVSVEVGFNHGEAAAWNLLKPVIASELNHVQKAIQTRLGVVITATQALKVAGAFDGAVGTYEKYIRYLNPLRNMLTVPMVIIGLEPPETFRLEKMRKPDGGGHVSRIIEI